jgi:hypothetical protein
MKFTLYLDAVRFCRQNKLSVDKIARHGELWKRYWVVTKPKQRKGTNATASSRKTTQQVRCT